MNENTNSSEEEKFSDDPREDLRMQNEFLKLKMMAESGAHFGGSSDLPPEIEHQFLQNVLEFEKQHQNSQAKKIHEYLGNPVFEKEANLDDQNLEAAWKSLTNLLEKNYLQVDFQRERSDRFKYKFITEELFEVETPLFAVKGMTTYFSYEEFHPDHEMEISEKTKMFLGDFLERLLDNDTYYINNELIEPDGKAVRREDMMKRFEAFYEATDAFEGSSYRIDNIEFELKEDPEDNHSGMGFSEGQIQYEIVFRHGERRKIDGPFKIYFSRSYDCWGIFFFYLAGFNMHQK